MTGERECERKCTEVKTGGSIILHKDTGAVLGASGPIAEKLAEDKKKKAALEASGPIAEKLTEDKKKKAVSNTPIPVKE